MSDTRIFARLSEQGTQYIAYQMEYDTAEPNAMILPIPARLPATEASVKFIDLAAYDDFFERLSWGFPPLQAYPMSRSITSEAVTDNLVVHQVGNFQASVVPRVEDFERLDPRFVIPVETWNRIPAYRDYSFVVFQLENLTGKPHPMAFEFATRLGEQIFFPTVHIHDGQVHETEDFDHELYCQHAGFDSVVAGYTSKPDPQTGFVRSKAAAGAYVDVEKAQGLVQGDLLLHRQRLKGKLTNQDTLAKASGHPTQVQRLGLMPQFRWPAVVTLGMMVGLPISWLVHRRNAVQAATRRKLDEAEGEITQ